MKSTNIMSIIALKILETERKKWQALPCMTLK
jgi:hypothetical protein